MKILYLIPKLNVSSGVANVVSQKANYLSKNKENEVVIVTQNEGNKPLFFELDPNIELLDIQLKGNFLTFLKSYKKQIESILKSTKPDLIVIADNGLKALFFNFIVTTKIPIILEIHCSKFVSEKENSNFFSKMIHKSVVKSRKFGAKSFTNILMLSEESKQEWKLEKAIILPNPVLKSTFISDLSSKKILCVTRNSYEKGLDRIIPICAAIQKKHPNWSFEIYCDEKGFYDIKKMIQNNKLQNLVLHQPTKEVNEAYLKSSIYISTSRFEVFPLVILEAMSFGLPIVAYDCPIGNKSIINNHFGFLIEDGNETDFIFNLEKLILETELKFEMGKNAKLESLKYDVATVFEKYEFYLNQIVYKEDK